VGFVGIKNSNPSIGGHPGAKVLQNPRQCWGFTLLEILIVTVIIGIALSLVVANMFPDEGERVRQESERTLALLESVRDESALTGKTIAVQITDNTLEFLERDRTTVEEKWLALTGNFAARPFGKNINAELIVGNENNAVATFQPAGVSLPFRINIASTQGGTRRSIAADPLGNLSLKDAP
jgi:general secretion pathway protein H